MVKYREFWFLLFLLGLVVLYLLGLRAIDDIGQFWVKMLNDRAQSQGISDKAVYWSKTQELYITTGGSLVFFLIGFGLEAYFLIKRLRTGSTSKQAGLVFAVAVLPFVVSLSRGLWFLHRQGKLL